MILISQVHSKDNKQPPKAVKGQRNWVEAKRTTTKWESKPWCQKQVIRRSTRTRVRYYMRRPNFLGLFSCLSLSQSVFPPNCSQSASFPQLECQVHVFGEASMQCMHSSTYITVQLLSLRAQAQAPSQGGSTRLHCSAMSCIHMYKCTWLYCTCALSSASVPRHQGDDSRIPATSASYY